MIMCDRISIASSSASDAKTARPSCMMTDIVWLHEHVARRRANSVGDARRPKATAATTNTCVCVLWRTPTSVRRLTKTNTMCSLFLAAGSVACSGTRPAWCQKQRCASNEVNARRTHHGERGHARHAISSPPPQRQSFIPMICASFVQERCGKNVSKQPAVTFELLVDDAE